MEIKKKHQPLKLMFIFLWREWPGKTIAFSFFDPAAI
jgi:hypothetical protein